MKIAFVIPWYGKGIPGGAESECRKTALHLKDSGFEVEILTTCVKDFHSDWSRDFHKEGAETVEGLTVRRFRVRKRDTKLFDAVNYKLMHTDLARLKGVRAIRPEASPVSMEEEETYINEMVNSPALYEHIAQNREAYDLFLFIPYMFGTSYFGAKAAGEKSVLIPCLHDESYAYMSIYKEMFRNSTGVIFHAPSEERLAERIFGRLKGGVLLGEGVDTEFISDGNRFRDKYSIDRPFILYAGRKDPCKNTPLLIDYFCRFKKENKNALKLVLMGSGRSAIPHAFKKDIIDLGFMEAQDKFDAYGAAMCLCQPSVNESFSLVLMEAWAAGTPALVNAWCEVTKDFCAVSGGGLYFSNYPEFAESVIFLFENEDVRKDMGSNGRAFVKGNYSWDAVMKRLSSVLRGWKNGYRGTPAAV
ncbi:MAG: glycosyltransferase family 4 protein [Deltaproteobacteria bacterium]|nr:glycosyltransferase family 4 protein [Deltaproteobacteria bacterium]